MATETQDNDKRFLVACKVIFKAGETLKLAFEKIREERSVGIVSTEARAEDARLQAKNFIRKELTNRFPQDVILASDSNFKKISLKEYWIINPVDGFDNLVQGIPFFCVTCTLVINGSTELGIIYDPIGDELFLARKGKGATNNGKEIKVDTNKTFKKPFVGVGDTNNVPYEVYFEILRTLRNNNCQVHQSGCTSLSLAYLATARIDAYWEHASTFPAAMPGLLLAKESGAWVENYNEHEKVDTTPPILTCNSTFKGAFQAITNHGKISH